MYDNYYYYYLKYTIGSMMPGLVIAAVLVVALWKIFKKANKPGWAAIIPFYNTYVLYDIVWGRGIKFLLLLIPIYNIVLTIQTNLRLAKAFGKGTGFGIGLTLLSPIFMMILGFGKAEFVGTDAAARGNETTDADEFVETDTVDMAEAETVAINVPKQATEKPTQEFAEPEVLAQEEKKQQTEMPQEKVLFCSQCGAKLEGGKFCPKCGSPVKK